MEQQIKPFEKFLRGNHLLLGEAGSGKTRLIWSILQGKEFVEDDSINIVLTDSEKRIWYKPSINPITIINPFDTNISWVTEPSKPGIYYCACEYAPRIITFLECLATWAIQNERNINNPVRIFVDFPAKYWTLPEFIEQLSRLHYISEGQTREEPAIDIWTVLGPFKRLSPKAKAIFQNIHLVLLNPYPEKMIENLHDWINLDRVNLSSLDKNRKEGYYYIPNNKEENIYLCDQPIDK